MSRLDGRRIAVETDTDGNPIAFVIADQQEPQPVLHTLAYWREWIGILDGEPERDIWRVETPRGICEIHNLRYPRSKNEWSKTWLLHAWED